VIPIPAERDVFTRKTLHGHAVDITSAIGHPAGGTSLCRHGGHVTAVFPYRLGIGCLDPAIAAHAVFVRLSSNDWISQR
jgi:hypothetical protein